MRIITIAFMIFALSGCATVQKYWPRNHDAEMFGTLVHTDIAIENINCESPDWTPSYNLALYLSRYSAWRLDPQADNLEGLVKHIERMKKGGTTTFCELGKRTARARITAAKTAWSRR